MEEKKSKPLNDELSALINGNDEYFKNISKTENKSASFGRNSGLEYKNKYSLVGGSKVASNNVVDISTFRKKDDILKPNIDEIKEDKKDDELKDNGETSTEDEDFDKFFDDFIKGLGETENKNAVSKPSFEDKPLKVSEPKVKKEVRKKKRAIDIDIISGGVGGDII